MKTHRTQKNKTTAKPTNTNCHFPQWNLPNLCFRQLNLPMETPLPRWHQLIGTLCGLIRIESQTFWWKVGTWSCQSRSLGCRSTSCGPAGAVMSLGCPSITRLVRRDAWRVVRCIQCLLGFIPADHCAVARCSGLAASFDLLHNRWYDATNALSSLCFPWK